MRQSGHWESEGPLDVVSFNDLLLQAIENLDVDQAREEVLPFVREPAALDVWSRDFFTEVMKRVQLV